MPSKIIILEDDRSIAELLISEFLSSGFDVTHVADGPSALKLGLSGAYGLFIADVSVPGLSGFEVCRKLRTAQQNIPIMFLTSRGSEIDRVRGFEIGADDYVTKPFSVIEVVARARALLRRYSPPENVGANREELKLGPLTIDNHSRQVKLKGKDVELTATEFDLLLFMASRPGKAFSREQLLNAVWGYTHEGYEHTVNTHINRLRSKIENDPNQPTLIKTVWGVGYRAAEANEVSN